MSGVKKGPRAATARPDIERGARGPGARRRAPGAPRAPIALLGLLALLAGGCASTPASLAEDAETQSRLNALLGAPEGQRCTAQTYGALAEIQDRYPDEPAIFDGLRRHFEQCQAWAELEAHLASKPEAERSLEEQVDLARVRLRHTQDFEAAAEGAEQLVARDPDNADYVSLLAAARHYQGRMAEAAPAVDRVWSQLVAAGNVDIMTMRALAYHEAGNTQRALNILEEALAIRPEHAFTLSSLSRVLASSGDLERAKEVSDRAQALRDAAAEEEAQVTRINDLARAMQTAFAEGRYEEAEEHAKAMLSDMPRDRQPEVYRSLEQIYVQLGRFDEANEAGQRASDIQRELSQGEQP